MGINMTLGSPASNGLLRLNCKIKLVISDVELGQSVLFQNDASNLAFELVELDPGSPVAPSAIGDAELLVVELRAGDARSMQRLTALRSQCPALPLIVAMRDADLATTRTLIRQGVNDVISLPLDRAEFDDAVNNLLAVTAKSRPPSEVRLAPVIAVAQSVGGIGATTLATHLAYYLAQNDGNCCLVDLDLQFGNAASYLGRSAAHTMAELLGAGAAVDSELLRTVATRGDDGVSVIAAPERIAPLEDVDADQLMRILDLARQEYDHVILDLPGNWANWTLSVIDKADLILVVVDLSIGSLRQARRRLTLFEETGIDASRIRIVANRVEKRLFRTISTQDAAEALGYPILGTVTSDYAVVQSAQDQGILVGSLARKNKVALDIATLADQVGAALQKG